MDYDISIVGYGPVGQTLSILLARKGWKVGVFERWPTPYPLPRAVHFDHEVARILQPLVDMDHLMEISDPIKGTYDWYNGKNELLLRLDHTAPSVSGFPRGFNVSQPEFEKVIMKACEDHEQVHVHMGNEVIDIAVHASHAELTIKDQAGNFRRATSRYIIGCDGANSFVRNFMNIGMTDLGFKFDWLVVDVIPHEKREWNPVNWQLCDPGRPTTVVSGGPGRRRWEFMKLPQETKEELNTAQKAWELLKPWNLTSENATLERHSVYTFGARWAESWRDGRLLLAGDAAHLMPPFYGQGMCSGIRDAANLAWKLDLVLQGKAEETLLDEYTRERKDHVIDIIKAAVFLGEIICITDPEKAAERDRKFFAGDVPPFPDFPFLTDGVLYRTADGKLGKDAGRIALQAKVSHQGKSGLFHDVMGQGWFVISSRADVQHLLSESDKKFLDDIGTDLVSVAVKPENDTQVLDVEGKYTAYFQENDLELFIVRPDYYIFGTAAKAEQLPQLISQLRTRMKYSGMPV